MSWDCEVEMKHSRVKSKLRQGPTIYCIAQTTLAVMAVVCVVSAILIYGLSIPNWNVPNVRHPLAAPFTETCWPVYGMEPGYCIKRAWRD